MEKNSSNTTTEPRESMVLFFEWIDAIKLFPDKVRLKLMDAIIEHGRYGTTPAPDDMDAPCTAVLNLIFPSMDRNQKKFEEKKEKAREYGRQGGLAKARNKEEREKASRTVSKSTLARVARVPRKCGKNAKNNISDVEENASQHPLDENVVAKATYSGNVSEKESVSVSEKENELVSSSAAVAATNEFEIRKEKFHQQCLSYVETYGAEMMKNFYFYWSEPTRDGTMMRCELEKAWSIEHRLQAWQSRQKPGMGSASASAIPQPQKYSTDLVAQTNEMLRKQEEHAKKAITYEEYQRQLELERQGFVLDDYGKIIGKRTELEAKGWKFGPLGEILFRPDTLNSRC